MDVSTKNLINPLVTVVICTYNREFFIKQCIDSVLNQKVNFKIEILIGDDCSTDETRNILLNYKQSFPHLFTIIFNKENIGFVRNWSNLMKLAKGKYIAFCDDDDFWNLNTKLQMQIDILEEHTKYGVVYTDYFILNEYNQKKKLRKINNSSNDTLLNQIFKGKFEMVPSSVVVRNALIKEYINFDDFDTFDFPIQDWVTWIQIAKHTEFYHLKLPALTYRVINNSMSRPLSYQKIQEKYKNEKIMYNYICTKFKNELKYDEQEYDDYVNNILLSAAFKNSDFVNAKEFSKSVKRETIKKYIARNKILFYFYVFMKKKINQI